MNSKIQTAKGALNKISSGPKNKEENLIAKEATFYDNFLEYLKKDHKRKNPRQIHAKKTLKRLLRSDMEILDVGCGTGISSYYMAKKGAKVVAIDLSKKLIEFARENSYHKNITYIVEDATNLNLTKTFDLITIIDSMEHIPRERIESFFQVLKKHSSTDTIIYLNMPDGRFQKFMKTNYPQRLQIVDEDYQPDFILQNFKRIGFEVVFTNIYGINLHHQYTEFIFVSKEKLEKIYKKEMLKILSYEEMLTRTHGINKMIKRTFHYLTKKRRFSSNSIKERIL